jgi:hypothetical protein
MSIFGKWPPRVEKLIHHHFSASALPILRRGCDLYALVDKILYFINEIIMLRGGFGDRRGEGYNRFL